MLYLKIFSFLGAFIFLNSCGGTSKSMVKFGNEVMVTVGHVGYGLTPQLTVDARQVAEDHCKKYNKSSVYTGIVRDSGFGPEEFDFKCIENRGSSAKVDDKVAESSKTKNIVKEEIKSKFSSKPINIKFRSVSKKPDDIAVIIGNANYEKQGKDIPNVNPAYADAEGIKNYFMMAKGIKEGNIIYLKDATGSQLASVFGNTNSHKARLFNWVKPKVSNIYVYYVGHGVPDGKKGNAYLVPTDADAQTIEFSGYSLSTLYSNLSKMNSKSVTVILEACFSGVSQSGALFKKASPIIILPKESLIPKNVKVIAAGSPTQMASWEKDNSHGLFTKYFLKAMSGEGDINKDGIVSDDELKKYLDDTMTYYARRYYGRDQNVQILKGN